MTEYGSTTLKPSPTSLSTDSVQQTREKRRKVLEAVFQRRKIIYKNHIRKLHNNLNKSEIDLIYD
jgi:hypothetical protein